MEQELQSPKVGRALLQDIQRQIAQQPIPQEEDTHLYTSLQQHLTEWLLNPTALNNSCVILHPPTVQAPAFIPDAAQQWIAQKQLPVKILEWSDRPDPDSIQPKLQHQLGGDLAVLQDPEVVIIPRLEWCFLRHVDGLWGIDWLCKALAETAHRFWILGAGEIGWGYLAQISQLDNYCSASVETATLSGAALQNWLAPVIQAHDVDFSDSALDLPQAEKDRDPGVQYFESLARIASGDRQVAVALFLNSLYQTPEDQDTIQAQHPTLPPLPPCDGEDLYLIYSLLLHGSLRVHPLAESLGVSLTEVQPRLQALHRCGIVHRDSQGYRVNALHYPRLKQTLANNNFVVDYSCD